VATDCGRWLAESRIPKLFKQPRVAAAGEMPTAILSYESGLRAD